MALNTYSELKIRMATEVITLWWVGIKTVINCLFYTPPRVELSSTTLRHCSGVTSSYTFDSTIFNNSN